MPVSKKLSRPRKSRVPRAKTDEAAPASVPPTQQHEAEPPLEHLRAELESARSELERAEEAVREEREARAAEAATVGEMLARVAKAEERARIAEDAVQTALNNANTQRKAASEMEESVGRLWRELGTARREIDARADQARKAEAMATEKIQSYERRIAELEARLRAARLSPTNPEVPAARASVRPPRSDEDDEDVTALRAKLQEAKAEARHMRESFETLQSRAGKIGAGLREMRELMVQSAELFDELEAREKAIAEIRGKSLREARALFMRAAGADQEIGRPPPPPLPKTAVPDLSEAAELLEEEIRRSTRPPPSER